LQLLEIPEDLEAAAAAVAADGALVVHWAGGGESRYHPGWLRAYSHGAADDHFRLPKRITWDERFQAQVPYFDGPAVLAEEVGMAAWTEALFVYGVAILENLPASEEVIERVPRRLGPIRETNFGPVFDVRTKADADSNAYTSMSLPVHSDLCTREYEPGLQFLHCLENAAQGGESILADGFQIMERLRTGEPDLFDALTTIPITYYNKAVDTDYRFDAPFLTLDPSGEMQELRWSPWLRAPVKAPFEQVERLYRGLRKVFAAGNAAENQIRVRLKPGDLLGFDNRRILHGRTGFDPATGNRWLRGCYVEREELDSRMRIIARHRRAAEVAAQ